MIPGFTDRILLRRPFRSWRLADIQEAYNAGKAHRLPHPFCEEVQLRIGDDLHCFRVWRGDAMIDALGILKRSDGRGT
jgi:hypothetical protein